MSQQHDIFSLWSQPVLRVPFRPIEVDTNQYQWAMNVKNFNTVDHRVLDRPELSELRELALAASRRFLREIMGIYDHDIFITDSWLNLTNPGAEHQRHHHKNSLISGVMFISGDRDSGGELVLHTDRRDVLDLRPNVETDWNITEWLQRFEPGLALVWPSTMDHSVEPYMGQEPRLSLAWNTWVSGSVNGIKFSQL